MIRLGFAHLLDEDLDHVFMCHLVYVAFQEHVVDILFEYP